MGEILTSILQLEKMKISLFLAGMTSTVMATEPSSGADCPNSKWEFVSDSDGNYCRPKDVVVTCDARQMFVTFTHHHIFKALDKTRIDADEAAAIVGEGEDSCSFVSKNGGEYSINFKLDKCGTEVAQENNQIIFSNAISGNTEALTIQGIIMTKILTFPVTCTYDDEFKLEIDPIFLNPGMVDIDGIHENGNFGQYFEMHAFKDDALTSEITSLNTVYIGDYVWVRIHSTKNLPSNVDYFLTDCTAYKEFKNKKGDKYEMIDDMCYSDLINADNAFADQGGANTGGIVFDFAAFAFSNSPSQVSMQCTIKLCALGVDGTKIASSCAVQPNTCPNGYSLN